MTATKIDRTQILDPKEFWPDALACPNWPHEPGNRRYAGRRGREGAEERLEAIASYLNRGEGELRSPTNDERTTEFSRLFRRTGGDWYSLGFNNLSALGRMVEDEAALVVDACHIRGYLRKVDAEAARDAEAKEQRRLSEARRTLADYRTTSRERTDEIAGLAEAAARHQQRIDDEKAFNRTVMLRQNLEGLRAPAVAAAHTLGLSVPDAPEFL